jgi:hypothetical protein
VSAPDQAGAFLQSTRRRQNRSDRGTFDPVSVEKAQSKRKSFSCTADDGLNELFLPKG